MPAKLKTKKQYKKLLSNFILLLIIINILTIICYTYTSLKSSYKVCNANQQIIYRQQTESFTQQLDNIMNYKKNIVATLASNDFIREFLSNTASAQSTNEIKSTKNFKCVLDNLGYFKNMDSSFSTTWISFGNNFILTNEGILTGDSDKRLSNTSIYSDIVFNTSNGDPWISYKTSDFINSSEDILIIISPIINNDGKTIGYIGVNILVDKFEDIISDIDIPDSYSPYITDTNGNTIYELSNSTFNNNDPAIIDIKNNFVYYEPDTTNLIDTQDNKHQYAIKAASESPLFNILMFADSSSFRDFFIKHSIKNIISLIVLNIILVIIPYTIYIRYTSKDAQKIRLAISKIDDGNYSYRINSNSSNEIGQIADSIDRLSEVFQEKIGRLEEIACYDALTNLPNKYQLDDIINKYIKKCYIENSTFAILNFDIDNFKWLNDSFGKEFCDNMLTVFAEKLKIHFGKTAKIGRLQSDSFIIVTEYKETSEIDNAIQKLRACLLHRIHYNNNDTYIKFSVGISTYPEFGNTPEALLNTAGIATDYVKKHGKNSNCYYTADMFHAVNRNILIGKLLNNALDNNEFYLHYQPIFDQRTKEIQTVEVFLRWYNNILGNVETEEFLSIAENNGTIINIMDWVFKEAFEFQKKICGACARRDIIISINISAIQLKQSSFTEHIASKIEENSINPHLIQFEINETIIRDLVTHKYFGTNELYDMGIKIAFDKSGTDFFSQSYINNFKINTLKIDRSMIKDISENTNNKIIIKNLVNVCHDFDIKVVAVGIETPEQQVIIKNLGVDFAQGYLLCKPLSETDLFEFARKYQEERDRENGFC